VMAAVVPRKTKKKIKDTGGKMAASGNIQQQRRMQAAKEAQSARKAEARLAQEATGGGDEIGSAIVVEAMLGGDGAVPLPSPEGNEEAIDESAVVEENPGLLVPFPTPKEAERAAAAAAIESARQQREAERLAEKKAREEERKAINHERAISLLDMLRNVPFVEIKIPTVGWVTTVNARTGRKPCLGP